MPLYSQGYSLARYFIQQGGKRKFVAYVGEGMQTNNWPAATRKFYGFNDLSDLQVTWVEWVRQGSPQLPDNAALVSAAAVPTPSSRWLRERKWPRSHSSRKRVIPKARAAAGRRFRHKTRGSWPAPIKPKRRRRQPALRPLRRRRSRQQPRRLQQRLASCLRRLVCQASRPGAGSDRLATDTRSRKASRASRWIGAKSTPSGGDRHVLLEWSRPEIKPIVVRPS